MDNPIVAIWQRAATVGDAAALEPVMAAQIAAGAITAAHIREILPVVFDDPGASDSPDNSLLVLAALLFRAAHQLPCAGRELRFWASLALWRTVPFPDGRRDRLRLAVDSAHGALASAPDDLDMDRRATLLFSAGIGLAKLAESRSALGYLTAALSIYRQLAQADPASFQPSVVSTLTAQGNVLHDLGQQKQAEASYEQALAICRGPSDTQVRSPDAGEAAALYNLATVQRESGRRQEARRNCEGAVEIYSLLAAREPAAYEPELGTALGNLALVLRDSGQRHDARTCYEEALGIYRRLVQVRPAVFAMDLAMTLGGLGLVLRQLGEWREARKSCEEALAISEQWEAAEGAAPEPDIAMALTSLGRVLDELGRHREARAAHERALTIYRQLSNAAPGAFQPHVAITLLYLSNTLGELREWREARKGYEEVVDIYRRVADSEPEAFAQQLAAALMNFGPVLAELGERELAQRVCEEALAKYRGLSQAEPGAFKREEVAALQTLGTVLRTLGKREQARSALVEALAICRRLAKTEPKAFSSAVGTTLTTLGLVLHDVGEWGEARRVHAEAVGIYRRLEKEEPGAFELDLAMALNNLGNALTELWQRDDAREAFAESLALFERLAQEAPILFEPYLAGVLSDVGTLLIDAGDPTTAANACGEALALYRRLAVREPETFTPHVAKTLLNLGLAMEHLERRAQARSVYEEALEAAQVAGPSVRSRIALTLGELLYSDGERSRGLALVREAVETLEAWLAANLEASERFSFKGEIGRGYRLLLGQDELAQEPERAEKLMEALREGELLASVGPGEVVSGAWNRPEARPGVAVLSIQRTHEGSAFLLHSLDGMQYGNSSGQWQVVADALLTSVMKAEAGAKGSASDIAAAGKALWDATPEWVRHVLSCPPSTGVLLSLDPNTGLIPLELMTPSGDLSDCICLRVETARVPGRRLLCACLQRSKIGATTAPTAVVVGNPVHRPTGNYPLLQGAEDEATHLASRLRTLGFGPAGRGSLPGIGGLVRSDTVLAALRADPSIVHFAGHGDTVGAEEFLMLGGADMLASHTLRDRAGVLTHSPLVYLNACRGGVLRAYGGAFRGLPIAFLNMGAATVVASVHSLSDSGATAFALAFYERLFSGEPVGDAVLRTRQAMQRDGASWLYWGLPVVYGNPHAQLNLPHTG
ncbi:MAG TPA: tetratricopeptide repeat protein [Anaerolineae bacterium]|nr:tetratricopeptide repeat protein [Anaerolineae bacterium]